MVMALASGAGLSEISQHKLNRRMSVFLEERVLEVGRLSRIVLVPWRDQPSRVVCLATSMGHWTPIIPWLAPGSRVDPLKCIRSVTLRGLALNDEFVHARWAIVSEGS